MPCGFRYFEDEGTSETECVEIEDWGFSVHFVLAFWENYIYTLHLCFSQDMLNTTKFIQKLTPGFKNLMRNLNNFRQAVESTKTWNMMRFCPKHTFLQLKHYIQRIYLSLMWSNCVKIHQITFVILETISHFSQLLCIFLVHYVSSTKVAHQSANFQTFHCSG